MAPFQLLRDLIIHHCWVITTSAGPDIGLQTVIQLDGDVLVRVTPVALVQPHLWRSHMAQVGRVLTAMRRLRWGLTWGTTVMATGLAVPMGGMTWWKMQSPFWLSCVYAIVGMFLLRTLMGYLVGLVIRRVLRGRLRQQRSAVSPLPLTAER
jgi:hypothetical protein